MIRYCLSDHERELKSDEGKSRRKLWQEHRVNYTPGLLVARNWNYDNKKMMPADYIAILEVKSPASLTRFQT